MHRLSKTIIEVSALAGSSSASASPTSVERCFETQAEARQTQEAFARRQVDNRSAIALDERALELIEANSENVELAKLKAVLGEPVAPSLYMPVEATYIWLLHISYSPWSSQISYDARKGYCVATLRAATGTIRYEWLEHYPSAPHGTLSRKFSYY